MKVTLLQKKGNVAETEFRAELDRVIRNLIGKLFAKVTFHSFTTEGWSRVSIDGDDAEVAVELLSRKFGIAPGDIANVALHGNYRGVIRETSSSNLIVDIGINHPKPTFINVKLSALLAQLADGRQSTSIRKITQNYCLLPETPISIRVTRLTTNAIEGWLSDSQVSLLARWISSGLERILVYNCLPTQLDSVMRKAQLERDIILTEELSLIVQSMLCKIGTEAVGLIPRVGSMLRKCELNPFIPRRIEKEYRVWQNTIGR